MNKQHFLEWLEHNEIASLASQLELEQTWDKLQSLGTISDLEVIEIIEPYILSESIENTKEYRILVKCTDKDGTNTDYKWDLYNNECIRL